jgi:hypothetical protein
MRAHCGCTLTHCRVIGRASSPTRRAGTPVAKLEGTLVGSNKKQKRTVNTEPLNQVARLGGVACPGVRTVAFADPLGGLVSTGGGGLGYLPGAHPQEGATAALR